VGEKGNFGLRGERERVWSFDIASLAQDDILLAAVAPPGKAQDDRIFKPGPVRYFSAARRAAATSELILRG
jgi:hypothetical protein